MVDSGGCSGFAYKFEVENCAKINEDQDYIFTNEEGAPVVVVD